MLVNFPLANNGNYYVNPFDYDSFKANRTASLHLIEKLQMQREKRQKTLDNYKCVLCKKTFNAIEHLKHHYELHKKCDETTTNTDDHHEPQQTINCPACPAVFDKITHYNTHVKKKHQTKEFPCDECDEKFIDGYHLSVHAAKHTSNPALLTCRTCNDYSTYRHLELMVHLNYHSEMNAEKFYCDGCDKYFMTEAWYNEHKAFHVKEKPARDEPAGSIQIIRYKCDECKMTFPFRKNLIAHNARLHAPPSLLCSVCGKVFMRQALLNFHMKIHGDREYACAVCGKTFAQKRGLGLHMRTHTGEKPYGCDVCEKSFSQRPSLVAHLRIHSGERPFACGKCEKRFVTNTSRKSHQKSCKRSG